MTCCGGSSSRLSWWVTSVCDWLRLLGFIWGLHGLLGNGSSGSFVLGSSRRRRGALGFIASANTGLSGRSLAGTVVGCEDAAKMVKLTRAGVPFFRRALLDKASHDSHSSAWTVPVCRLMQICLRSGAAWAIIGLFGPTYLSVPLHKTTCLMLWSGHICWTKWMISACSTTRVPTRGAVRSAQDMTVCQLISAGSLTGLSLDGLAKRAAMACGLSFMPNRRRLVGCSSSPAKIGNCGGWSCMMIFQLVWQTSEDSFQSTVTSSQCGHLPWCFLQSAGGDVGRRILCHATQHAGPLKLRGQSIAFEQLHQSGDLSGLPFGTYQTHSKRFVAKSHSCWELCSMSNPLVVQDQSVHDEKFDTEKELSPMQFATDAPIAVVKQFHIPEVIGSCWSCSIDTMACKLDCAINVWDCPWPFCWTNVDDPHLFGDHLVPYQIAQRVLPNVGLA